MESVMAKSPYLKHKTKASRLLKPYYEAFHECVVKGFNDYEEKYSKVSYLHRSNTERSIKRDHIVQRLRDRLPSAFNVVNDHGTTFFDIKNYRLVVRKFNASKKISQNWTRLAKNIQRNKKSQTGGEIYLYLGYMDPVPGEDPEVLIVCPKGLDVREAWSLEVTPPSREDRAAEVTPYPTNRSGGGETLVRVKQKRTKKANG